MTLNLLFLKVKNNWIDIESSGTIKKVITVKHNGITISSRKSWFNPGIFVFDVEEDGNPVHYQIILSPGGRYNRGSYSVRRNNEIILSIGGTVRNPPLLSSFRN